MSRRRIIWGLVAFVVAFTVAFFLSGEARAVLAALAKGGDRAVADQTGGD